MKTPAGHGRFHQVHRSDTVGNNCGRRVVSVITRCDSCGGACLGVQQYELKSGQHVLPRNKRGR